MDGGGGETGGVWCKKITLEAVPGAKMPRREYAKSPVLLLSTARSHGFPIQQAYCNPRGGGKCDQWSANAGRNVDGEKIS